MCVYSYHIIDCFTSGDQFDPQLDYVDFNRYNIYDEEEDYIRRYISPNEGEPGIRDDEMIYNYIIRHPRYNDTTNDYDYAILVLNETEAIYSNSIPNLALNFNTDIPFIEQELQVVGWGALEENGFGPDVPHQVKKNYITNEQCTSDPFQYEDGMITSHMLCAADIDGDDNEEDSCQGDSGGPLMIIPIDGEEEPVQVGIVSWGLGCARFPYPGVYAGIEPSQSRRRSTEESDNGLSWILSTILERTGEDISPTTTTTSSTVLSTTTTSSSMESSPSSSGTTTTIASGDDTSTTTASTISTPSTTTTTTVSGKSNKSPKVVGEEDNDDEEGDDENDNSSNSKSAKGAKRDNRRCNKEERCMRKRVREHKHDDVSFIIHTTDEEEDTTTA